MIRRLAVALVTASGLVSPDPHLIAASTGSPRALVRTSASGTIDWRTRTVSVVGEGHVPPGAPEAQGRLLARRAAVADAYRRLAESVNGVQVTVSYTAGGVAAKQKTVYTRVHGLIKGAKPGEPVETPDGTVTVGMTMPLYGNNSLAWGLELGQLVKAFAHAPLPVDELAPAPATPTSWGGWTVASLLPFHLAALPATGVIVDAAGLGVEPAMAPFVLGVGQRVYVSGKVSIDPDRVVRDGITAYAEDLEAAKKDTARLGTNPVVITAKGVVGHPSTDILVSDEDAQQLQRLNQEQHLLDLLKVTIII